MGTSFIRNFQITEITLEDVYVFMTSYRAEWIEALSLKSSANIPEMQAGISVCLNVCEI